MPYEILLVRSHGAVACCLIVNKIVVGFIPIGGNVIFSFPHSSNSTMRDVEFRHSTCNISKIC